MRVDTERGDRTYDHSFTAPPATDNHSVDHRLVGCSVVMGVGGDQANTVLGLAWAVSEIGPVEALSLGLS